MFDPVGVLSGPRQCYDGTTVTRQRSSRFLHLQDTLKSLRLAIAVDEVPVCLTLFRHVYVDYNHAWTFRAQPFC